MSGVWSEILKIYGSQSVAIVRFVCMGLDSVELVLAIEEAFDITITDEEASGIRTVGDMLDLLVSKLQTADNSTCQSQRAFHVLRRGAQDAFGIQRRKFRPNALLEDVVPVNRRRDVWSDWQMRTHAANWPVLVLPNSVNLSALGSILATSALITWWMGRFTSIGYGVGFLLGIVTFFLGARVLMSVTRPLCTAFPRDCLYVRDLALFMLAKNPQTLGFQRATWTRDEIYSRLRNVIVEQTTVDNFDEQLRFVDDMGID